VETNWCCTRTSAAVDVALTAPDLARLSGPKVELVLWQIGLARLGGFPAGVDRRDWAGGRKPPPADRSRLSAPWHEDGQVWRALLVTYSDTIVAHQCRRTYYFDGTGLLQRLDYSVDILGAGPAMHYSSAYRESDGILVPTRRRVYVRSPEGSSV